ncbi:L-lactate dehydrogenase [Cyclobacteriaceae bacterium YHN15]|jgi:L-lactate dehydrogenase complex protein LldG|nr:L-lactate dehydrogenase [Cyclobacteriaceae bacterium YHN15]
MSSRDYILSKIRNTPRDKRPLPEIPDFKVDGELMDRFKRSLLMNKGEIVDAKQLEEFIDSHQFKKVLSLSEEFRSFSNLDIPDDAHQLADMDVAIISGQFGVAENAAIWLEERDMGLRALPFITEHLVIVLEKDQLVSNMHEAYERIGKGASGFGLFIAGPSKTADIEQSLVIGAHGAKSLRVVLV